MSGLIWAGIGKGIADAGATFGNYMAKDIEATRLDEREALREERLLKRQEALDQLKADREETKAKELKARVASESVQIQDRAADAPVRRDAAALGDLGAKVAGDAPVMPQEEREALIRENPHYRDVYRKAGLIGADKMDPRLREATDQYQAALEIGAHSSVIEAYAKQRKDVLDQIRVENSEKRGDQKHDETMAAITERGRQADAKLPIAQQNANSNTTRADAAVITAKRPAKSGGGGGAGGKSLDLRGLQIESTAASRTVEAARKSRDKQQDIVKGSYGADKEAAKTALADANKKLADAETRASEVSRKISEFNTRRSGGTADPKNSDNRSSTSGTTTKNYSNLWKK